MSYIRLGNKFFLMTFESNATTMKSKLMLLSLVACLACVGVDYKDDTPEITIAIPQDSKTSLQVGETIQLSVSVKYLPAGKIHKWASDQPDIASVNENGLVTAKAKGLARIAASIDAIKSNEIEFNVDNAIKTTERKGTFQGSGSYSAKGTVTLTQSDGVLTVAISSDYQASVALGTVLYLANSINGAQVKSAGLELGEWSSGAKIFNPAGVTLNQYKYVVVLCKPAGITFGNAELKP
jgi:Bacterial Ig-like domain (group 2)